MSDFEDKLNKIMSSPEDMEKIMGMARSLSGSLGTSSDGGGNERGGGASPDDGGVDLSSIASALGSVDPKMLRMITRAFGQFSSKDRGKADLLHAIKPYLKEDKRDRMDKAAEIVKIAGLARIAFSEFSGGEDGV